MRAYPTLLGSLTFHGGMGGCRFFFFFLLLPLFLYIFFLLFFLFFSFSLTSYFLFCLFFFFYFFPIVLGILLFLPVLHVSDLNFHERRLPGFFSFFPELVLSDFHGGTL